MSKYLLMKIDDCRKCPFVKYVKRDRYTYADKLLCANPELDTAWKSQEICDDCDYPVWCPLPDVSESGIGFVQIIDGGRDKPRDNLDEEA